MWLRQLRYRKECPRQFSGLFCDNTCRLSSHIPWHPLEIVAGFGGLFWSLRAGLYCDSAGLGGCRVSAAAWSGDFKDGRVKAAPKSHKTRGLRAQMGRMCRYRRLSTVSKVMPVFTQLLISIQHTLPVIETQVRLMRETGTVGQMGLKRNIYSEEG